MPFWQEWYQCTQSQTTAHVGIDIGNGNGVSITSSIANAAVDDLGLRVGDSASATVKASDVLIGKPCVRGRRDMRPTGILTMIPFSRHPLQQAGASPPGPAPSPLSAPKHDQSN
jgi:molybdopterin-binding protein